MLVYLTITKGDASTVVLEAYTAQARNVPSAVATAATVGGHPVIRALGDHREHVTTVEFTVEVTGVDIAAAYDAAYAVIEDAAAAVNLAWHQGDVDVLSLRNVTLDAAGPAEVRLRLAWWPANAGITPPPVSYSGSST